MLARFFALRRFVELNAGLVVTTAEQRQLLNLALLDIRYSMRTKFEVTTILSLLTAGGFAVALVERTGNHILVFHRRFLR